MMTMLCENGPLRPISLRCRRILQNGREDLRGTRHGHVYRNIGPSTCRARHVPVAEVGHAVHDENGTDDSLQVTHRRRSVAFEQLEIHD